MLKKTNKAIASKLMSLKPESSVMSLLLTLGYTDIDADFCAFSGNYFDVLLLGSKLIDDAAMELKMQKMSPEDRKK